MATASAHSSTAGLGSLLLAKQLLLNTANSRWQLWLLSASPLIIMSVLYLIFSAGIVRGIDIAVIDLDHSQSSRLLSRYLNASPTLTVTDYSDADAAITAVRKGHYSALVTLPYGLHRKLANGRQPEVDIRYNGQYLLLGKQANSAIQQALASGLQKLSTKSSLLKGLNRQQIAFALSPVRQQITPLNNRNSNYLAFLLPAIMIALWQLVSVMAISNACAQLIAQPALFTQYRSITLWLAQFIAIALPLWLLGIAGLAFLYGILALPLVGSLSLLIVGQLISLIALFLIVAVLSIIFKDNVRSISICAALFAPAFAFMGVTFPSSDMPLAALIWRQIIPSSHYMQLFLDQLSRSANLLDVVTLSQFLFFFTLCLPLMFFSRQYRTQILQENNSVSKAVGETS
ncbi:ABC transporter permease [Sinobacterium norvegicum]|uniref:ABC transporter permease n=1 Tax=Sinobacterium norvegicum TaxID=1641715 RepID=UPI001F48A2F0|nr:ABC transporter permease [Sinobacterium norvegicum]